MRTIDEIRADWNFIWNYEPDAEDPLHQAQDRMYNDIPDLLAALAEKDAEIERLRAALSAAKELFEDECTPDERDSFAWLMQTEELLGQ